MQTKPPPGLQKRALPKANGALRHARRVVDFLAALLCLWAAWAHTPPGALLRTVGARVLGMRTSARPLLAYYSAGVYASSSRQERPLPPPPRALQPAEALGYGAWAALTEEDPGERAASLRLAQREGFAPGPLLDPNAGPPLLGQLLQRLARRLGSDDLAALALFCGEEAASYAARAADPGATLEELARVLPERLCDRVDLAGRALAVATAAGLAWPLAEGTRVTSPFGEREHPVAGGTRMHKGIDLAVPIGTPVRAAGTARVRRASHDELNGRILVLDHGHGVSTLYLHNDALLVASGDGVARAEVIARSGNSGRSTGPHLHFQLELSGVAVDPLRYHPRRPP